VVLQAGAMGLPCIVTDIPGSNEIIINNQNGLIIQAKNKDQLFHAMVQLLTNQLLRKNLSKDARSMIVNRYQQGPIWEELLEEYRSLLGAFYSQ
jgi:glycosyltransferase involved in cell wall biosynthesis